MSVEQRVRDTLVARTDHLFPVPDVEALVGRGRSASRRRLAYAGSAMVVVTAVLGAVAWTGVTGPAEPVAPSDRSSTIPLRTTIPMGDSPEEVVADPAHGVVYVSERGSAEVAVVDTTTARVVEKVDVGGRPRGLAVDLDAGQVYATVEGFPSSGSIVVIDTGEQAVVHTIPLGDGALPFDLALDQATHSLFVSDNGAGAVDVVDTRTWKVVDTIPVGGAPAFIAVDPQVGEAYVATDRNLTVIDTRTRQVRDSLDALPARSTRAYVGMVATDPAAGVLLVANPGYGTVSVVDTRTHELTGTVTVGGSGPIGLQVDPGESTAYVTGAGEDGAMAVLDLDRLAVLGRVAPAMNSIWVGQPAVDPGTGTVYAPLGGRRIGVIARQ